MTKIVDNNVAESDEGRLVEDTIVRERHSTSNVNGNRVLETRKASGAADGREESSVGGGGGRDGVDKEGGAPPHILFLFVDDLGYADIGGWYDLECIEGRVSVERGDRERGVRVGERAERWLSAKHSPSFSTVGDLESDGCIKCRIPTPSIDALMSESTLLSSYYVTPLCSPSRSALLTSRYSSRDGYEIM